MRKSSTDFTQEFTLLFSVKTYIGSPHRNLYDRFNCQFNIPPVLHRTVLFLSKMVHRRKDVLHRPH